MAYVREMSTNLSERQNHKLVKRRLTSMAVQRVRLSFGLVHLIAQQMPTGLSVLLKGY